MPIVPGQGGGAPAAAGKDLLGMSSLSTAGATAAAAATVFACPGTSTVTAETQRQYLLPSARTFTNLRVRTGSGSQPANGSLVITLRVNGADTALTVTVPAGSAANTVVVDTTHSVDAVAGNLISWEITNNSPDATSAGLCQIAMDAE